MASDTEFPCLLVISVPFPDTRLASSALRAIEVDQELSPLVRRSMSLAGPGLDGKDGAVNGSDKRDLSILKVEYRATTNRMLRVAVNGFMESLGVVVGVMQELDVDVLEADEQKS
ncbi:transcription factor Pcc1 [Xylona heveae TC161]|uniref:Transcription factor Pcc1 n=1 Tax=Xylona heveae (strain CBS 132557 / TC161) TaxID=1328760 RepID=A0A165HKT1_XYLHT|nr:transcription factor Pcc1 [Xylona heveae TC161]KZF23663.1 transcription factor Pcc1 [Xylona heveae TC161]